MARAPSTACSGCAAIASTTTPGPPRATPAGTPTRSTRSTGASRTSRTAPTSTAAPAARSRSPATPSRPRRRCSSSRPPPTPWASRTSRTTTPPSRRASAASSRARHGGIRYSSSRGYLTNADRPTLQVQSEVHVQKVVIENGRATGVEVVDKGGKGRTIRAGREVIVSAGVFGSAQLLMLSGVGPAAHLAEHGIDGQGGPPGRRQPARPPVRADHVADAERRAPRHPDLLRPRPAQGEDARRFLPGELGVRDRGVRPDVLGHRRPDLQIHVLPWAYPSPNQDARSGTRWTVGRPSP